MDLLPHAKLEVMLKSFTKAEELIRAKDPEKEPYKSKYQARDLLLNLLADIDGEINEEITHACAIGAALYTTMGCLDMDVQELSQGEEHLKKSCDLMNLVPRNDLKVLFKIKTLNQVIKTLLMR